MNESRRKNDIFYMILLILAMIVMIVGITFTYFSFVAKEKDDGTKIRTGILSINYIDGKKIDTYDLMPIKNADLDSKYIVRKEFVLSNDGTLDENVDIYINVTKNDFNDNALGFSIYDSSKKKLKSGSIPKTGRVLVLSDDNIKSGKDKTYTVIIWLKDDGTNQNYEQGNSFSGAFDIYGRQLKY